MCHLRRRMSCHCPSGYDPVCVRERRHSDEREIDEAEIDERERSRCLCVKETETERERARVRHKFERARTHACHHVIEELLPVLVTTHLHVTCVRFAKF